MGCKCACYNGQFWGWECEITGGQCMFFPLDSKRCAEVYGEGPDAIEPDTSEKKENFY